MSEEKKYAVEEAHRFLAAKLNGDVWSLLEKPDRSRDEDESAEKTPS